MGHSPVTKRRLRDADAGNLVTAEGLEDCSLKELQARYSALCDSIVAAQSLDDLGPEMNKIMWDGMMAQQKEKDKIAAEIKKRGAKPNW